MVLRNQSNGIHLEILTMRQPFCTNQADCNIPEINVTLGCVFF
jgi:hypothetical protein